MVRRRHDLAATHYAVSDRTFELNQSPSWEGHLYLVTANQDGFYGDDPRDYPNGPKPLSLGGGWGCDAGSTTYWSSSPPGSLVLIPSCIPDVTGSLGPTWGGYSGPKAAYVPTILDELNANGVTWKLYGGTGGSDGTTTNFQSSGYQWDICPTFAECLYSSQRNNLVPESQVLSDASAGALPGFSIITPTTADSQHNAFSMSEGDNYIGQIVSAIQNGPDWSSTAIFITYDDCGCFYDHVNPLQYNSQWGVRVPMVIVSPFAKEGYTDSGPTTFAGTLAFAEDTFGLHALNANDGGAYDYRSSFCFYPKTGCTPVGTTPVPMTSQVVPPMTSSEIAAQTAAAKEDT
jgi:phospholipase C